MFALIEGMSLFNSMTPAERLTEFSEVVKKDAEVVATYKNLKKLMARLRVIQSLEAYANSLRIMNEQIESKSIDGYVVLVVKIKEEEGELITSVFAPEAAQEAENMYLQQEKDFAAQDNVVVAMVSTSSMGEIKTAYPNYFADSSNFIALLQLIKFARV